MLSFARLARPSLLVLLASTATPAFAGETGAPLPGLAELHRALGRPEVAGSVPAPASLRVGHAEIRPAAGSRLLVLTAAGHRCGWVLDGPGTLVYRVEDRFSIPVARRNLKQNSGLDVIEEPGALVLTTSLRGAAVWGWELELPQAELRAEPGMALPEWLRDVLERKIGDNPALDVLQSAYNGDAGYRWATFHGASEDLILDFDARLSVRTENLARWRKLPPNSGPYSGRLFTHGLASQPTERAWWEPRRMEFVTSSTEIKAVSGDDDQLSVETRLEIRALRDGLRVLSLTLARDLYDHRLRKREMRVSKLTVDGQEAPFLHLEFHGLLVELPKPLGTDQVVTVEVVAAGDILIRPFGDNYWRLGNEAWYPRPMHGIGREWSSFRIDAETRSPFLPFAPGTIFRREKTATGNRVVTELAAPMENAFLLAGKYATISQEKDGRRVHVSTYATVKDSEARRVAQIVASVQACMERWLGVPYPFQDLQLVEVNSWGWGQAPPGFVFITAEAFLNEARSRDGVDENSAAAGAAMMTRGINERVAHEVAHGWFPHVAKTARFEEDWLSESFADYASAICLSGTDKRQAEYFWTRQLRTWKTFAKRVDDNGSSIFLANYVSDGDRDTNSRYYLLYGKGPLVLHALRQELGRQAGSEEEGDRLFMTWIRSYVKNFTYKTGETRHLVAILEQMTGKPWQPWFERYVYGTETPKVD
jgi:hypothetical protein